MNAILLIGFIVAAVTFALVIAFIMLLLWALNQAEEHEEEPPIVGDGAWPRFTGDYEPGISINKGGTNPPTSQVIHRPPPPPPSRRPGGAVVKNWPAWPACSKCGNPKPGGLIDRDLDCLVGWRCSCGHEWKRDLAETLTVADPSAFSEPRHSALEPGEMSAGLARRSREPWS